MATLFWLTGLAGAGKSSAGCELFEMVRSRFPNAVFLDGDSLRSVLAAGDADFTRERRLALAFTYARLCKLLTDQNLHVICATVSMFRSVRSWLRQNVAGYREIYLRVPIEILVQRDQHGLYSRALRSEASNVVGVDMEFEEPDSPDLVLDYSPAATPHDVAVRIFESLPPEDVPADSVFNVREEE